MAFVSFDAPASGGDSFIDFSKPQEPRSLVKEVPIQAYAGATVDLPKQVGQAMQWMSEPGHWAYDKGRQIQDWSEQREQENPDLAPQVEGRGILGRALSTGARAIAPSAAVMVPAAVGAAAAPLVGAGALVGAAVGAGAGAFGLFGSSQAQETYDKLLKSGVPEPEAKQAGWINLMIEGGGETIGNVAGLKLFGVMGKAFTKGASPVANAIAGATDTSVAAPFLKQLPKTAATEIATEFGQNFGEAWVENKYGAANAESPLHAGIQGAEAALGMTILLAPFGLAGFAARAKRNQKVADALQDPDAPKADRIAASTILYNEINAVNQEAAKAWSQNASFAIVTEAPILLDEKTAQPGMYFGGPGQPTSAQDAFAQQAQARVAAIEKAETVDQAIATAQAAVDTIDVGTSAKGEIDAALNSRRVLDAMEKHAQEQAAFAEQERAQLTQQVAGTQPGGIIGQKMREALGLPPGELDAATVGSAKTLDVGQQAGNGQAVGGGNTQGQAAGAQSTAQGDNRPASAVAAPKTVAGVPQESIPTPQLQAIVENPATPPITRHAAVTALQARTPAAPPPTTAAPPAPQSDIPKTIPATAAPAEKTTEYRYSSTQHTFERKTANGFRVAAKRIIAPQDIHPEEGLEKNPHITVKYGLHTENVDEVRPLLEHEAPVKAKVAGVDIFQPEGKDYDVVVARVDSPDLHRLNAKLKGALPHTDTFPTYQPHVTLGYVKRGAGEKYKNAATGLEGKEITLDTVDFSNKDGKLVPIKLGGAQPAPAAAIVTPPSKQTIRSDPLIRWIIRKGGIDARHAEDIWGERGFVANQRVPGLFRKMVKSGTGNVTRGLGIDDLAQQAVAEGHLTQAEADDVDGGVQALKDKINAALHGERQVQMGGDENAQFEAMRAHAMRGFDPEEIAASGLDELDEKEQNDAIATGVAARDELQGLADDELDAKLADIFGPPAGEKDGESSITQGEEGGRKPGEDDVEEGARFSRRTVNNPAQGGLDLSPSPPKPAVGAEAARLTAELDALGYYVTTGADGRLETIWRYPQDRRRTAISFSYENERGAFVGIGEQFEDTFPPADVNTLAVKLVKIIGDGSQSGEPLTLTGQTEAEARAAAESAASTKAAEEKRTAAADEADRKSREAKEIAQRSAGADFALTSTEAVARKEQKALDEKAATDQLAGQGDIFSQPAQAAASTIAGALRMAADQIEGAAKPITDFGEKIGGARKDYAEAYRDRMKEASDMDVATEPLSKSWPEPDYQKLLEGGADAWSVAFAHSARDEVPTKPTKAWRLSGWVKQVQLLRDVTNKIMSGEISAAEARRALSDKPELHTVADRAELYAEVGHDKSLKGVRISSGSYSMYNRVEFKPPKVIWTVERKTKTTAMSRWPQELAHGDTRAEAIANFKKAWSEAPAEQEAKAVEFDIYSRRGTNAFFIGKKIGKEVVTLKDGFATAKEARQWKIEHQAELVATLQKFKEVPNERRESNSPRVGEDHRNGADVTPEQFGEAFGFRGVEFGNYVEGPKRQADLNEAYDALMDLAGVLDIPPKALALNGELGLAFGARGKGGRTAGGRGAAAHYEPDYIVINLTKEHGAGSLAHEWFHAVDNYFSRARGEGAAFLTERPSVRGDGVRPEMVAAFKRVMDTIAASGVRERSRKLDRSRSNPYWGTNLEMAARSFESYIIAKLHDQGASNDYLANIVSQQYWDAAAALGMEKEGTYPYPADADKPAIRAAFDAFFKTVETRETDTGVALFSRAEPTQPLPDLTTELAKQFPGVAVQAHEHENGNLDVSAVVPTTPEAADNGHTFKVMRRILKWADQNGRETWIDAQPVALPPGSKTKAMSLERLVRLYERMGFVKTAGQAYSNAVTMSRAPRGVANENTRSENAPEGQVPSVRPEEPGPARSGDTERNRGTEPAGATETGAGLGEDVRDTGEAPERGSDQSVEPPGLRRSTQAPSRGLSVSEAEKLVAPFDKKLTVPILVFDSTAAASQSANSPFPDDAKAAYYRGMIYVIAPNISDALDLERAVWHETTHAGIHADLGTADSTEYRRALIGIAGKNQNVRVVAAKWKQDFGADYQAMLRSVNPGVTDAQVERRTALLAIEEAIAKMSESGEQITGIQRLIGAIQKLLRSMGFDHLADWMEGKSNAEVMQLIGRSREAVTSGERQVVGERAPAFSEKAPPFYSALAAAVEALPAKQATAQGWKEAVKGLVRKGAVKQAEVDAVGLNEFLDMIERQRGAMERRYGKDDEDVKKRVTRDQVSEFLRGNGVRVEETTLHGNRALDDEQIGRRDELDRLAAAGHIWNRDQREEYNRLTDRAVGDTKFGQYQLPGGENYRELLLRLPARPDEHRFEVIDRGNNILGRFDALAEADDWAASRNRQIRGIGAKVRERDMPNRVDFRSSHFDQPNILAHVRFNERTDAEGKRVLFIEELQSDWAQKGKREGFKVAEQKSPGLPSGYTVTQSEHQYHVSDPASGLRVDIGKGTVGSEQEARDYAKRYFWGKAEEADNQRRSSVPSAPFVTKTEAWVALSLKRMIRYAAENGFDRVAWTTGEQQAGRYDLSKQVDAVLHSKNSDGTFNIDVEKDGRSVLARQKQTAAQLEELIGKDVAQKIVNGEGTSGNGEIFRLSGAGLKVGGEGMRAFYDKIVPNVANDVLKKLGGGRVGTVSIKFGNAPDDVIARHPNNEPFQKANARQEQPGFDITPAMRDAAMAGQPLFSRSGRFSSILTGEKVSGLLNGAMQSPKSRGVLSPFQTQYHKAVMLARKGKPEFKAVFDRLQSYLNDISAIAVRSEQHAPGIFRELRGIGPKSMRDYFKGAAKESDIQAIGPAMWHGTLFGGGNPNEGRAWTDEELRFGGAILKAGKDVERAATTWKKEMQRAPAGEMRLPGLFAPLTDKQIALYKQARAAINQSLEDSAKSIMHRQAKRHGISFDRDMSLEDVAAAVQEQIDAKLEDLSMREGAVDQDKIDKERAELEALKETITGIEDKASSLIAHGYTPLMRFGNRTVTAKDEEGKTVFFGIYDGKPLVPKSADREMHRAAAAIRAEHPEWSVTTGVRSEQAWKMYEGLNLEAMQNFLDFLDPETKAQLERDATIQEYLRNATNNRSVLKRLIHRKGTPGFATDVPRVLASFVTSSARNAAGMYNLTEAKKLVEAIPDAEGDIKDDAANLVEYVTKPNEEAAMLRSFLFFHYLGGSVASAAVNLTQTVMMTAPYLAQSSPVGKVVSALKSAAKRAFADPATMQGDAGNALQRAEREGITAPQQIYHLTATAANNPFSSNRAFRTFQTVWGGLFGATEVFNRRVAFLAAHDLAKQRGESNGKAYESAKTAVNETQGIYNRGNRPNVARGALGATVMTFKQFSIMYLELLRRLPPQQQLMMMGILLLAAGGEGLPFAEDIEDLIDTLGQWLGFTTNTGKWIGKQVKDVAGKDAERPLLKGLGGILPIDLHSRLGMANMVPGTAFLKPSEIDKTRDVAEAVGPVGSVLQNLSQSLQLLARGKWDSAAVQSAPKAVRDAYNGAHMIATGEAEDIKGRITLKDVTPAEAFGKAVGFNPQRAAAESETKRELMQDRNLRLVRMDEIAGDWADGIVRKDRAKIVEAQQRFRDWNQNNPQLRIDGASMTKSVTERVRAARMTSEQRFIKSTPKAQRNEVRQELAR